MMRIWQVYIRPVVVVDGLEKPVAGPNAVAVRLDVVVVKPVSDSIFGLAFASTTGTGNKVCLGCVNFTVGSSLRVAIFTLIAALMFPYAAFFFANSGSWFTAATLGSRICCCLSFG
jgi:hypothetical protein